MAFRVIAFQSTTESLFVPVEILQRFFGVLPAVVAAAVVEVDQPQTFHFDPHFHDRLGPFCDDLLAGITQCVTGEGFYFFHGNGRQLLHLREEGRSLFIGKDLLHQAQG